MPLEVRRLLDETVLRLLAGGDNGHHVIEACFKGVARALRAALAINPRVTGVPSTKGSL